jgi:hypothetical protein
LINELIKISININVIPVGIIGSDVTSYPYILVPKEDKMGTISRIVWCTIIGRLLGFYRGTYKSK